MKIINTMRTLAITAVAAAPCFISPMQSQSLKQDTFEYTVPAAGSSNFNASAPSPKVSIAGVEHNAAIVVDISKNILYKYDSEGHPETAYRVASGKKNTPTHTGVRIVTHVENYPYSKAYGTKRKRNPKDYGPNVICLNIIDPKTGEQSQTGEFIHGNNNVSSLGKYASRGCIRMDNEVIKKLSKEVKGGDIVLIRK